MGMSHYMTTGEGESALGPTRRAAKQCADRAQEIFRRFASTRDGDLLEESINEMRAAVDLAHAADMAEAAVYQVLLHTLRLTRWRLVTDQEDLEGILQGRFDGDAAIEAHPVHRPIHMSNVATALEERFSLFGRPEDIEEAIARWEQAVRPTAEDDPLLDFRRQGLERARRSRAVMADPQMSEVVESEWLQGASDPLELMILATGHHLRFVQGGPVSESDAAISLLTRAIDAARDAGTRLTLQGQLGMAWDARFRRTGLVAHLDRAIALYDEVLTAIAGHRESAHVADGEPAHQEPAVAGVLGGVHASHVPDGRGRQRALGPTREGVVHQLVPRAEAGVAHDRADGGRRLSTSRGRCRRPIEGFYGSVTPAARSASVGLSPLPS